LWYITITSLLSKYAKRVIGIEVVREAIKNAKNNAILNKINNVLFMEGKVEDLIESLITEQVDTIVMDPPRSGVDRKALNAIIEINPKQIVYVSCDPVTLARDLKILAEHNYEIKSITPFDMFPQTSHVETVVLMSSKDKF
jgi:23S rRNA (uracil1939-C5)-methyltransferase